MGKSEVIVAKDLAIDFRGKTIWKDVNFSIGQGEFVAIIGPNGAGKTTCWSKYY